MANSESPYLEQPPEARDSSLMEFGAARSDHDAIALYIGRCYAKAFGEPLDWPPAIRAILLLGLDAHLMHRVSYEKVTPKQKTSIWPALNPFHAAAISFSDRISRNRLEFRRELEDRRARSQTYYFLIVGLGALATILVSIRAMMPEAKRPWLLFVVSAGAIIASAAGTATSSLNSFEGDQAAVLRDQRALAQLQQLHWRVASDVLQRTDLCQDTAKPPDMEVVNAWRTRLEEIMDTAQESIAQPGDLIIGQPGNPSSGSHQEPVLPTPPPSKTATNQ